METFIHRCIIGNRVLSEKQKAQEEKKKNNISLNKTVRILILYDFDSAESSHNTHCNGYNGFQKYSQSENELYQMT